MRALIILLVATLGGCSEQAERAQTGNVAEPDSGPSRSDADVRSEFLRLTAGDPWVEWPTELVEDENDRGRACRRVTEQQRENAIALLEKQSAVELDAARYRRLIGTGRPPGGGLPYLLRGYSSTNSTARVKWAGNDVVVHTDTFGPLLNVRRHPCVSVLTRPPEKVFNVAAYDL